MCHSHKRRISQQCLALVIGSKLVLQSIESEALPIRVYGSTRLRGPDGAFLARGRTVQVSPTSDAIRDPVSNLERHEILEYEEPLQSMFFTSSAICVTM